MRFNKTIWNYACFEKYCARVGVAQWVNMDYLWAAIQGFYLEKNQSEMYINFFDIRYNQSDDALWVRIIDHDGEYKTEKFSISEYM